LADPSRKPVGPRIQQQTLPDLPRNEEEEGSQGSPARPRQLLGQNVSKEATKKKEHHTTLFIQAAKKFLYGLKEENLKKLILLL